MEIPNRVSFPDVPPVEFGRCERCGFNSILTVCDAWMCGKYVCTGCYKAYSDCGMCLDCAVKADREMRKIRWPRRVRAAAWHVRHVVDVVRARISWRMRWLADRIDMYQQDGSQVQLVVDHDGEHFFVYDRMNPHWRVEVDTLKAAQRRIASYMAGTLRMSRTRNVLLRQRDARGRFINARSEKRGK
jgi:hypothetical protein